MIGFEKQIYTEMLNKLVSSGIIPQRVADQLTTMLEEKKTVYKAKKHIGDLLSLLSSIEALTQST
jgi:uncharacterized protein YutE (UPF0331/DUF86 family)